MYIRRWDTYIWAWVEYNRKEEVWTYGGIQKNKNKGDENKEGQGRISDMFTGNQMDVKEDERQSWDDSGRDNEDSDAGIWMVETLRRRLRIGVTKRSKVNIRKVRRELLAAHIWKEESFRVEMDEEEKGRRTKKTKDETTEMEEENKTEFREIEATRETWEARQIVRNMEDKTLEGMGFNEKAESSSRGERIRKREQYQRDSETYEYSKEKDGKNPRIGHVSNKRKRKELKEKLEGQIREWSRGEKGKDEITTNAEKVLNKKGEATTELIRKVIRDGMDTEKLNTTEEIYKYNEYIILDATWGQYTKGNTDKTKTIFQGRNAYSGFQKIIGKYEKVIAIIHYEHHWSFTVINIKEGKVQMYDSMEKVGHKEANEKLKSSLEEILRKKQQKEWTLERMYVPQQTDSESCGYRMLYNMNEVCNQRNIESIANEEMALEGYTLEIIEMLKGKQHEAVEREEEREKKKARKAQETEEEIEKEKQAVERKEQEKREETSREQKEEKQELEKKTQEMQEKIIRKRVDIEKKRKIRDEEEEENKRKKKQKKAEGMEDENKRQLKRTRQQQKQENAEEKHEGSKLRSGKIRKINSVELSLSSRCRDAPD